MTNTIYRFNKQIELSLETKETMINRQIYPLTIQSSIRLPLITAERFLNYSLLEKSLEVEN